MSDFLTILNRMLDRVSDDRDKRVGAIIYDTLSPTSMELAELFSRIFIFGDQSALGSATGDNLDNWAANFIMTRNSAVTAIRLADFTDTEGDPFDPPIGSRFRIPNVVGNVSFILREMHTIGVGLLECETPGEIGNEHMGRLLSLQTINNLGEAILRGIYRPGQDTETDDALRQRIINRLSREAFAGNVAAYKEFTNAIPGVGGTMVFPVWNNAIAPSMIVSPQGFWDWFDSATGIPTEFYEYIKFLVDAADRGIISTGGTVLVSIVDGQQRPVSPEFIDIVQTEIDPIVNAGEGLGTAPIGHRVTVTTPNDFYIDVSATLYIRGDFTISQLQPLVEEAINEYIVEVRRTWADSEVLQIFVSRVIAAMLTVPNIENATNVMLNGGFADIIIPQTVDLQEVPLLGTVTLTSA